jgi:hypothetical protein
MSDLPKFYIINNGMKDLRGHYFETAISIAEAARDMGWRPILTGHATCELGMIPEWLEFYPVFRTDHWMASKIEDQSHIETQINFAEYHQASIENVKASKATFQQFINSRFYIRPELNAWNIVPVKQTLFTRITHRIKDVYNNDGLAKLLLLSLEKIFREFCPPIFLKLLKKVLSPFLKKQMVTPNRKLSFDMDHELQSCSLFKNDLSKILALTKASPRDFVFLPTAHGRELLAIAQICEEAKIAPRFGLEFRHALDFPLVILPPGEEHAYVGQHRFYFEKIKEKGLSNKISLFTDTKELAEDYVKFSDLNFSVLPIPFRQDFLENHNVILPNNEEKLRIVYIGDPREEKGFHWLPFLIDFLSTDYLIPNKVVLEIQASVHPVNSELKCINALEILKSYPKEWINFHGLNGPLNPESYYKLLSNAHVIICPYDKLTYHSRSSGTLTEAIAAGVPTIVPAKTWLSNQQPNGSGLPFDGLQDFLIQTKNLIDLYPVFLEKAKLAKIEWQKKQDPKDLIKEVTKDPFQKSKVG